MFKGLKKIFGGSKKKEEPKEKEENSQTSSDNTQLPTPVEAPQQSSPDPPKEEFKPISTSPVNYDPNEVCHRILYKGSNIDIQHFTCFPCSKIKEKANFLTTLGFKDSEVMEIKYFVFLDEIYFYLMKDIVYDPKKPNIRRLGNKYNLFNFMNISFNKIESSTLYKLDLEISDEERPDESVEKELIFQEEVAQSFFNYFGEYLTNLGILRDEPANPEEGQQVDNENAQQDENPSQEEEKEDQKEDSKEDSKEGDLPSSERKKKKKKKVKKTKVKDKESEPKEENDPSEASTETKEKSSEAPEEEEKQENEEEKKDDSQEKSPGGEEVQNEEPSIEEAPKLKHKKKKKAKKKKAKKDSAEDENIQEFNNQEEDEAEPPQ